MQSEAPLTLILSPLRARRGELERTCLGSLLGDPDTVPPKVPLSLRKRERITVRVRLDCMDKHASHHSFRNASSNRPRNATIVANQVQTAPLINTAASVNASET